MASGSSAQDAAAATMSEVEADKLFAEELDTISDSQLAVGCLLLAFALAQLSSIPPCSADLQGGVCCF